MSDSTLTKDPRVSAFAADRVAGMRYRAIANKHGVSVPMVRTLLRRAMMKGEVTAEAIRYEPTGRTAPVLPDGEYNAKWVSKVMSKVQIDASGCWLWQGFKAEWGYGQTNYRGASKAVHRQMYQVTHNVKLTRWQLVMHKCDVPHCVNPSHLVLGTPHDNVQDAANKGRHHNARKTHCKRGHELSPENVNVTTQGLRQCKACARARQRINAGWTPERAYSVPAIPFNEPTPTRVWAKGKVA
jgi:hypothetical protein